MYTTPLACNNSGNSTDREAICMVSRVVPQPFIAFVVAALALLSIAAYAIVSGIAILAVWNAVGSAPTPGEPLTYLFTALAGLVGGIVAVAFGVSSETEKLGGLSNLSTAGASAKDWIGGVYVVVYLVVGIAAVVTWSLRDPLTSELVKNLAMVTVGMIIPIVAGYFAAPAR